MTQHGSRMALVLSMLAIFAGGCATSEHRMNTAADRDDTRRGLDSPRLGVFLF